MALPRRRNDLFQTWKPVSLYATWKIWATKYEVTLETPGIPKDKITVKAGIDYIDISGENEKKTEEKRKNYLYNERLYSSLRRRISTPEEIDPSKVDAKMENGVLHIEVSKKTPTQNKETKVEVK